MHDTDTPIIYIALEFLTLSSVERLALLPHTWSHPVYIDNGYRFEAHQPIEVMQDLCARYLTIHEYEFWIENPNFSALAIADGDKQIQVESIIDNLREKAYRQSYLEWLNDKSSMHAAQIVLNTLQWPLLLGAQPPLTQAQLYQLLDDETYGTFTARMTQSRTMGYIVKSL